MATVEEVFVWGLAPPQPVKGADMTKHADRIRICRVNFDNHRFVPETPGVDAQKLDFK